MLLLASALASDLLTDLPPGTALQRVERGAEYERWYLHSDRDFVVEVTASRPGTAPVCAAGGRDLWVRLDVAKDGESFVWDPLPEVVRLACSRLGEHGPEVQLPLA